MVSFKGMVPFQFNSEKAAKRKLTRILKAAYSGEFAASVAYTAQSETARNENERQAMLHIAQEELDHRDSIAWMLEELDSKPSQFQEKTMLKVSKQLARKSPQFLRPVWMKISSIAEAVTVHHYKKSVEYAKKMGRDDLAIRLQEMVDYELDHVDFFKKNSKRHEFEGEYHYHKVTQDPVK